MRLAPQIATVTAGLLVLSACGGADGPSAQAPPVTATAPEVTTTTVAVITTTAPPPTTATTTIAPPAAVPVLGRDDHGSDVRDLQERLVELGYWLGPADGDFGLLTEQAVYAFQKVNGLALDGVAGEALQAALEHPVRLQPRSRTGIAFEVDKALQVLLLARDGEVVTIWNTSTGTEQPYRHDGRALVADTPSGRYAIEWRVDGWRDGELGRMYRPTYFHPDGIAIHGYHDVPPRPASHGCVRVTIAAMDHIWESGLAAVGTPVLVYGTTPV